MSDRSHLRVVTLHDTYSAHLLDFALAYARLGWQVFPLHWVKPNGKCSCNKEHEDNPNNIGKHPITRSGLKDATTNPDKIGEWWTRWKYANVGIRTGAESDILVVDIDPRHNGEESLLTLIDKYGELPETPEVLTGSNGRHLFFAYPTDRTAGSRNGLEAGVDIKADGGYVVAAPSLHVLKRQYRWIDGRKPGQVFLAEAPTWALVGSRHRPNSNGSKPASNGTTPADDEESYHSDGYIREGERDDRLTKIAGGLRRQGLNSETIFILLKDVNEKAVVPPMSENDIYRIAHGMERYRTQLEETNGVVIRDKTDIGNAQRLVDRYGHDIKYTNTHGWLYWDGSYWRRLNSTEYIKARAIDTVQTISIEADALTDAEEQGRMIRWRQTSSSSSRINAMVDLARSMPGIAMDAEKFDTHPWLLNVRNGTIDLKTGTLWEPERGHFFTKISPTFFDPNAKCPVFDEFLDQIMDHNKPMIEYMQRFFGYCITGVTHESIAPIFHGAGANGKTTLLNIIQYVLGRDYAGSAPPGMFTEKRGESHPTELADLQGKRMVVSSETDAGDKMQVSRVKLVTGGENIKARFMRQDFFEFEPTFKIIISTNNLPRVNENDHATWRRLRIFPFGVVIPANKADTDLPAHLRAEASGILNWLIRGCLRWQKQNLSSQMPPQVLMATDMYKRDSDVLADFLDSRCVFDPKGRTTLSALYTAYRNWASSEGVKMPLSKTAFGLKMTPRPQVQKKSTRVKGVNTRYWAGIKLRQIDQIHLVKSPSS